MITLIEMVRLTRENNHRYCAVDANGDVYSGKVTPYRVGGVWIKCDAFIGGFKLTCDWKNTLIDVNKVLVK